MKRHTTPFSPPPAPSTGSNGAAQRASFAAQSSGLYLVEVMNVEATGNYTFSAVDTTLFNVRWNTLTGYDTQWILLNISDMQITGTLTVVDMNRQTLAAVQFSISPGGRVTRSSGIGDINLRRNAAGSVLFAHNGPPGAVIGEAFMNWRHRHLAGKVRARRPALTAGALTAPLFDPFPRAQILGIGRPFWTSSPLSPRAYVIR
jgi:hypothetical protein